MLGETVRAQRRRLGLTQEELAEKTGVSVRSIRNLEAGRIAAPRPATVRLLADAFGLAGADRDGFCRDALDPAERPRVALVPAQLPNDIHGFAGRVHELARLDALLAEADDRADAVVISAMSGTAGVGKTALAVRWAHRVRDRFTDGQLYVNLRGFDPIGTPVDPATAVRGFLEALDVPAQRIPADLDGQAALYRSVLADKRMLVVLDNARDTAQVRPLLPAAPGCLVLVTSRNELSSLVASVGARPLTLDLLSADEARSLLSARIGADRVLAESDAVDQIITATGRLPLALAVVAARAAAHSHHPLAALAAELQEARLDALSDADDVATDIRTAFSCSYRVLTPGAARLFRLLGLHPGPDISAAAAVSLAGLPPARVQPLLAELARAHLVEEHSPGRYTLHDLLRSYARDLAQRADTTRQNRAARRRLLDHYLHSAHSAATCEDPVRGLVALDLPAPGVTAEQFDDRERAIRWFIDEQRVLQGVVGMAITTHFDLHAWRLGWILSWYWERVGTWHDGADLQRLALSAAERLDDREGQARVHRSLGRVYGWLGRHDEAEQHLRRSIEIYAALGDHMGEANGHGALSWILGLQDRHEEALAAANLTLHLSRLANRRPAEAQALNVIGSIWSRLGDHRKALAHCGEALAVFESQQDRFSVANTYENLGRAHHHLGQHAEAFRCFEKALELYRGSEHRYFEAETLDHLGDTHYAAGDRDAATDAWLQALNIFDDLDHPDAGPIRAKLDDLDRP